MGELHNLPRLATQQSPAGTYGFEPPTERPRVDVTGCLDGYAVTILGRRYAVFKTLTNAARCAAALTTLDALDALLTSPLEIA
tara:strand:+ start:373 stop:621 length:249 start_codon:yes stop_codon:yes gene_type:complete